MVKSVCVFGASRNKIHQAYFQCAGELGRLLAQSGMELVFGGGAVGLMGAVAKGVAENGGRVTGVIPERLNQPGIAYEGCEELVVTPTMHARKAEMERRSDGFVALPGGFGTLEELMEVLTLNQLGYLQAPVVILDMDGFYQPLKKQLELFVEEGFTDAAFLRLCIFVNTPQQAVAALKDYRPPELPDKIKDALDHGQ